MTQSIGFCREVDGGLEFLIILRTYFLDGLEWNKVCIVSSVSPLKWLALQKQVIQFALPFLYFCDGFWEAHSQDFASVLVLKGVGPSEQLLMHKEKKYSLGTFSLGRRLHTIPYHAR